MKKVVLHYFLFSILLLSLSACERESTNGIATYINPPKDSVKFAYRLSTLYFIDYANNETSFDFIMDTGLLYVWKSVVIHYEKDSLTKTYTPEYSNGYLVKLTEDATSLENIEIAYALLPPSNIRLISSLKYNRENNPFALTFIYDSARLSRIERRYLDRFTGEVGTVIEKLSFCPNTDLGSCNDTSLNTGFQYSIDFNNLYHCNELLPFILLLNKPKQDYLEDILMDLPYYFSRHFAETCNGPVFGNFQRGLNTDKEATFLYYRPNNLSNVQGYNFSMR